MRGGTLTLLLVIGTCSMAQEMTLTQGTLHVIEGTVLEIRGDVQYNLLPSSQVINDGRIELRDGARLAEAPGAPVTGTGTEHAWIAAPEILNAVEPGGLGLQLTTTSQAGPLEVIRGHQPMSTAAGQQSVARWYSIVGEGGAMPQFQPLVMRVDPTELNGLTEVDLDLHDAMEPTGPWVPMLTQEGPDPLVLTATSVVPRTFITAFHYAATTSIPELEDHGYEVWPTLTDGMVHVRSNKEPIRSIELLDTHGRIIQGSIGTGTDIQVIDISGIANGAYLLRLDHRYVFKIVKG
jgi:hypothetical protein